MWSFFSRDPTKDFNFDIGEILYGSHDKCLWSIHKAKRKGVSEDVSVFVFDIRNGNNEPELDVAKSAVKRLKTVRHPSILTFLDSLESEKVLYLATEYVEPLIHHLERLTLESAQRSLYISWGIFQITRALSFLNNDGNLRHNNVNIWSVFVNSSGEWKLGGVEYVSSNSSISEQPKSQSNRKLQKALDVYETPEKPGSSATTVCSIDMWGLGCLIWEVFNGPLQHQQSLRNVDKIPSQIGSLYCELISVNPKTRPNPADVIMRCRKPGGYFKNDLVDTLLFLEEIQIKDKTEKNRFFSNLTPHLDSFPSNMCKYRILPQLITAFDYGDAGSAVLTPMFKLGRLLDESEYQKRIVPCVIKLFSSNDRATRSRLLQQLEHFIGHLQSGTVNEQIFPQIMHGFLDTNPTIREQTVKSVVHLAPKLNYNNLNVEVLRHFARLQIKDDQGGIRTNTTVCLGKIASHLHPQIRQKVLIAAFIRAMRDPFAPARTAGILALAATQQYYLLSDVAGRIVPALAQLTVDPEKSVRDSVFRTIKGFLGKLQKVSDDPSLRESMEADVNTATPSLSNAAATWAGWAVTAVTAKFYRSQSDTVKSSMGGATIHRLLNKPCSSLEQPSSSSISTTTTTSSVTSMTSLEHEENSRSGGDSVSDYDYDNWADHDNWGEIETTGAGGRVVSSTSPTFTTAPPIVSPSSPMDENNGWDNEDWGSLEEELADEDQSEGQWSALCSDAPQMANDETGLRQSNLTPSSSETLTKRNSGSSTNEEAAPLGSSAFTSFLSDTAQERFAQARKKRDERKLQRQMEMEGRRTTNRLQSSGPMKLGAKKI